MGIVYGIAIGYNPALVFPTAIVLNFAAIFVAIFLVERLFVWREGIRFWIERRLRRGQKIIDKYGCVGILMGVVVMSPIQLAILGRLIGIKPRLLYPTLLSAIIIVATAFLGIALGIFKILL
jgi:hypothetical protein